MENSVFKSGKFQALLMGLLTVLLCLVLGDGFLGLVSYRDDPTMKILVVLPGMAVFTLGLFLPPWLFRKRVHKRDTFLNIPLYAVSFFLLRGLFEERVFLTQHFFLRKHLPGFFSIPGEQFLLPLLLVGSLWGVQWFFLSACSSVPPKQRTREQETSDYPAVRNKLQKIKHTSTTVLIALMIPLCISLFFLPLMYPAIKDWLIFDERIELFFDDEHASYIYDFSNRHWLISTFSDLKVKYPITNISVDGSRRINAALYVEDKSEYEMCFTFQLDPGEVGIYDLPYQKQYRHYRIIFYPEDADLQEAVIILYQ